MFLQVCLEIITKPIIERQLTRDFPGILREDARRCLSVTVIARLRFSRQRIIRKTSLAVREVLDQIQ